LLGVCWYRLTQFGKKKSVVNILNRNIHLVIGGMLCVCSVIILVTENSLHGLFRSIGYLRKCDMFVCGSSALCHIALMSEGCYLSYFLGDRAGSIVSDCPDEGGPLLVIFSW